MTVPALRRFSEGMLARIVQHGSPPGADYCAKRDEV